MPNWVKTRITFIDVSDDRFNEIIDQYVTRAKTKEDAERIPDFNKIIPMPDNIFRGNLGIEEEIKYGKNNWYDWSRMNWGTKWNSSWGSINDHLHAFEFETAWSFAFPVIRKLAELTNCQIEAIYADEDIGSNFGMVLFDSDGSVVDQFVGRYEDDEGWEIIEELWGVTKQERF